MRPRWSTQRHGRQSPTSPCPRRHSSWARPTSASPPRSPSSRSRRPGRSRSPGHGADREAGPVQPRPRPRRPRRRSRTRPRCGSRPSTSAPPAPTAAPPATGCKRALSVAREIKSRNPGIVAIQELGPGRADGKKGKIKKALRQTDSLEKALSSVGAGKYKLVRTTAYVEPGTAHGTQGARILYDTTKYRLVSQVPRDHRQEELQRSCSMDCRSCADDEKSRRRSAAYAEFEDRGTGRELLRRLGPPRRSAQRQLRQGEGLDRLRAAQIARRLQQG